MIKKTIGIDIMRHLSYDHTRKIADECVIRRPGRSNFNRGLRNISINKEIDVERFFAKLVVRCGLLLLLLWALSGEMAPLFANDQSTTTGCENAFSGVVFFDNNRDGHYEAGEGYLPGEIQIVDPQGNTVQTVESADGFFRITTMPCDTYQVLHNRLVVGAVVVDEVMGQDLKVFPKATTLFFPLLSA